MVKNSRRKKQARRAADANGTNYTTAMRAQRQQPKLPNLPQYVKFPAPGSADFTEALRLAGEGVLRLGATGDGEFYDWDLNEHPHGILTGATGRGKSNTLSNVVTYGLVRPDEFDVLVCDPKVIEFNWTDPHLPADGRGKTEEDCQRMIAAAHERMVRTRALLEETGARNLTNLRRMFREDHTLTERYGVAPKRTLVVIDELYAVLSSPSSDKSRLNETASKMHHCLKELSDLGPEPGIHLIWASQVPPNANSIFAGLAAVDGLRVDFALDYESEAPCRYCSDSAELLRHRRPHGRAVIRDSRGNHETQIFSLPSWVHPDRPPHPDLTPNVFDVLAHCSTE